MLCRFTDDAGIYEDGIESGRPRWEFLRLLMKHIQGSCLFTGPQDSRLLNLDSRGKYKESTPPQIKIVAAVYTAKTRVLNLTPRVLLLTLSRCHQRTTPMGVKFY